jgi:hypothetical protein
MGPRLRQFALTLHVTSSVGLLGAIAAFLALAVTGVTNPDEQMVRAAYLAMSLIARFVVVPLAFASLLTGLIQSLGTAWGLFRHYWVLVKLLFTIFGAIVLLLKRADRLRGPLGHRDNFVACQSSRDGNSTRASRRRRSGGAARAHGALDLQAAGHDALWVAKAVPAATVSVDHSP